MPNEKAVEYLQGKGYAQDSTNPNKFSTSDNGIIRTADVDGKWVRDADNPNWKKVD